MSGVYEEVQDVLNTFKTRHSQDANALHWFQANPAFQSLVLAWPRVEVKLVGKAGEAPDKEGEMWAWLWKNYRFNVADWIELAGIADKRYGLRLVDRVIRLRMVFPDGSYPRWLERFLRLSAVKATQAMIPSAPRPPEEEEEEEEMSDE